MATAIASKARCAPKPPQVKDQPLLIGGKWHDSVSGKTFATLNPATGEVICQVAEGDKADVDLAVKAARKAFEEGPWRKMNAAERGRLLYKLADLIEKNKRGTGRAGNARQRQAATATPWPPTCRWRSSATATMPAGRTRSTARRSRSTAHIFCYTRHEPVGVVGQIIPWNFPLLMQAWKWGPALAAGCTIVLKPAEQTPLTALRVGELAQEAGIPRRRDQHRPRLRPDRRRGDLAGTWTSTRSPSPANTRSARSSWRPPPAATSSASRLELGGKSPNIVFADADLDAAVEGAYFGLFFNQGQCCCAGSRLFVEDKIHDAVRRARCSRRRRRSKVGDPFDPETDARPAGLAGAVRPHHGLHRVRQEGRRQAADRRQPRRQTRAISSSRPSSPTSRTT